MAVQSGLDAGSEIVLPYGPLAFLNNTAMVWYENLAVLTFLFRAAVYLALSISLVWALRRTMHWVVAVILAVVILTAPSSVDVAIALTAVWCLAALCPRPPPFAAGLVMYGGAAFGALQSLIQLRTGPVILVMCIATLLAQEGWRRRVPIFIGCTLVVFSVLWFVAGQGIGNLPDFARISAQIASGYSQAMGSETSPGAVLPAAIMVGAALVAAATVSADAGRARIAAAMVMAAPCFAVFKESFVRYDIYHRPIFFGTALLLGAAIPFGRRRLLPVALVTGLAAVYLVVQRPDALVERLSPVAHAREARDDVRVLLSPERRGRVMQFGRLLTIGTYRLDPATLRLLRGHTVHVDPWEAGVVWAYGLTWHPLPVFQDYEAYTATLDRLNADALRGADGPQRILRENTRLVDPARLPSVDARFPAWDAPGKAIAMLCNSVPLRTTARWQVLGKVANRCGSPQRLESVIARGGEVVRLPEAKPGSVLFAKIHGAGVSGSERIRTFLYRANPRYVVVNGTSRYRLVPGTAADGLIMDAAAAVDLPAPFALAPQARTIQVLGPSGPLRMDLYRMRVRPR